MKANNKFLQSLMMIVIGIMLILTTGCAEGAKDEEASVNVPGEKQKAENSVEAYGVVKPEVSKNIVIDFPAKVKGLKASEGEVVLFGDILMELDLTGYYTLVREAKTKIDNADHEVKLLENDLSHKKGMTDSNKNPEIKKLMQKREIAKKVLEEAEKKLAQKKELLTAGIIPKNEVDNFALTVEEKANAVIEIELEIEAIKAVISEEITAINRQYEMKIKEMEALKTSHEVLQNKISAAFINGNNVVCDLNKALITGVFVNEGDALEGGEKIIGIADADSLYVEAEVAEEFIADVKEGAKVKIIPVANRNREYQGIISEIARHAVTVNGETNIPVKITVENIDSFLLPGFNVDLEILSDSVK